MSSATAPVTSSDPSPAADAATPASPASRPLRPLAASQLGLQEHQTRHHVCTLPPETTFEVSLTPEFWANVVDRLRVCDRIDVFDARGTFFAELLVRQVTPNRSGIKGGARMQVLRHVELEPVDAPHRLIAHEVQYRGPSDRWCVIRISDGAIVARHFESRELAERHAATMVTV